MRQASKIDLLNIANAARMRASERETSNALARRLVEHVRAMRAELDELQELMEGFDDGREAAAKNVERLAK